MAGRHSNRTQRRRQDRLPEVNLGRVTGTGGTRPVAPGRGRAGRIELMVTGNTSFEEAKSRIINESTSATASWKTSWSTRGSSVAQQGRESRRSIKRAVQTGWEIPMESALAVRTRETANPVPERRRERRVVVCREAAGRRLPRNDGALST